MNNVYTVKLLSSNIFIIDEEECKEEKANYGSCLNNCKIKSPHPFANVTTSENGDYREISQHLLKYPRDVMEDKKIRYCKVS